MSPKKIIIFVSALILLALSVVLISDDLFSPYVSFEYAVENQGKNVQIIGRKTPGSEVEHTGEGFRFTLTEDEGMELQAFHRGAIPMNFDHAEQVVLIGKYSAEKEIFEADRVLVKCPSKYEKEIN